jgi:hypothetical protein
VPIWRCIVHTALHQFVLYPFWSCIVQTMLHQFVLYPFWSCIVQTVLHQLYLLEWRFFQVSDSVRIDIKWLRKCFWTHSKLFRPPKSLLTSFVNMFSAAHYNCNGSAHVLCSVSKVSGLQSVGAATAVVQVADINKRHIHLRLSVSNGCLSD